jgi:hypothetical protein
MHFFISTSFLAIYLEKIFIGSISLLSWFFLWNLLLWLSHIFLVKFLWRYTFRSMKSSLYFDKPFFRNLICFKETWLFSILLDNFDFHHILYLYSISFFSQRYIAVQMNFQITFFDCPSFVIFSSNLNWLSLRLSSFFFLMTGWIQMFIRTFLLVLSII